MQPYTQTNSSSTPIRDAIEIAVGGSVFALRKRELDLFAVDFNSPTGVRLAAIRGEFQRLLSGECIRSEVIERALARAVQPPPANSPEVVEPDLATEPVLAEVRRA